MLGTLVNCIVIILGCVIGLIMKGKVTERMSTTIMNGLGLCVLIIGIKGAFEGEVILSIISITIGAVMGEYLDIDNSINKLGRHIESKLNNTGEEGYISRGFITASLLFCVGAMSIVGALESGLDGNHTTLYAKSMLDGISSVIFASTLGIGVMLSAVTVLIYQGSLTIIAGVLGEFLNQSVISNISSIGSILIIGLALNVLGITKIKIANLLPAILITMILGIILQL